MVCFWNRLVPVVWLLGCPFSSVALAEDSDQVFSAASFVQPIEAARPRISEILEKTQAPGLSVAVEVGGKLVWSQGYGFADPEKQTPAARKTVYRIGSVSKLLTAAALMKLREQDKIDLDAPITRYVRNYPEAGGAVTLRQLAGHTAGIRHYAGAAEYLTQSVCATPGEALAIFKDDPLLFEPGSKYSYSSYGYVLLSAAIAQAAAMPFPQLVDRWVLAPLEMKSTSARWDDASIPHQAALYSRWQGKVSAAPLIDLSCRIAAGSYLSTAEDLAKFLSAHGQDRFFSSESLALLFTPQTLRDGAATHVGIGWRIGNDSAGRQFVHHGGDIVGGRAFVLFYPAERVAVAICTNLGGAPFEETEVLRVAAPFLPEG